MGLQIECGSFGPYSSLMDQNLRRISSLMHELVSSLWKFSKSISTRQSLLLLFIMFLARYSSIMVMISLANTVLGYRYLFKWSRFRMLRMLSWSISRIS